MPLHIMLVTDGPFSGTGFSEEARNIGLRLAQLGFKVSWLGLQHFGGKFMMKDELFPDVPHESAGIQVLGNYGESFGSTALAYHYPREVPDLVMFIGDSCRTGGYGWVRNKMPFPFGIYVTLDGLPIHPSMIQDLRPEMFDFIVTMTQWAMTEYAKVGIPSTPIYHGTNTEWWKPQKGEREALRKKYGIAEGCKVYMSLDVNQYRKRQDVLLKCWKKFRPETKNAILILYTDWRCEMGWDFNDLITQYGIPKRTVIDPITLTGFPKKMEVAESYEKIREIMLLGDIYVSCSGGEGFGKNNKDAQAAGLPVIAPAYSAIPEVVGEGGILVPISGTFRMQDRLKSVDLGLVDEKLFVEALKEVYRDESELEAMRKVAFQSAAQFDYDKVIVPQWAKFFNSLNPDEILIRKVLKT